MTSHQTVRVGPCGGPILPPDRMLDTVSLKKKKQNKKNRRSWAFILIAVCACGVLPLSLLRT